MVDASLEEFEAVLDELHANEDRDRQDGQLDPQPGEPQPDHRADGRQDPDRRGGSDAHDGPMPGQDDAGAQKTDPRNHLADDPGGD